MVTYRCPGKTLSALVARTTEPGQLVELARYVGDITGLRLFKEDKEVSPELLEHGGRGRGSA